MVDEKLDVKGQVCPMPVVFTKRSLERIQSGQILEVTGDCGPSFESIQKWVTNQGHEVVEASKSGIEYKIIIRKH